VEALEADHAALRPDLVGAGAVRNHEIGLRPGRRIGEDRLDRAVARFILMLIEPLAREAFRQDGMGVRRGVGRRHRAPRIEYRDRRLPSHHRTAA